MRWWQLLVYYVRQAQTLRLEAACCLLALRLASDVDKRGAGDVQVFDAGERTSL